MHFQCSFRKRNIIKVSAGVKFGSSSLVLSLLHMPQLALLFSLLYPFNCRFGIHSITEKAERLAALVTHFPLAIKNIYIVCPIM